MWNLDDASVDASEDREEEICTVEMTMSIQLCQWILTRTHFFHHVFVVIDVHSVREHVNHDCQNQ